VAEAGPGAAPRAAGLPTSGAAALLLLAAAPAWATSFAGGFQFDDWNVIVDDPRVASLAAWWRAMPGIRPLTKLSFALDHQAGLGLAGFHATSLAIHLGAALLGLALLRRLEAALAGADAEVGRTPWAAVVGALLFAVHPVQTEAVTYLSGRAAALAALLALASLLAWLRGRDLGRPWLVHVASPLLLAGALAAKESAAPLPLTLLLLAAARPAGVAAPASAGRWRRAWRDTAVHWLVLAGAALALLASPAYRAMLAHARGLRPPLENLRVHLDGLAWLAGQVLRPGALLADPGPPAPAGPWWPAALAGLAVVALAVGGLAALLRAERAPLRLGATPGRRAAALAALWWLAWLPPSGWLLPRPEAANDRQAYLALLGPAWLLGRWLAAGLAAPGPRRTAAALLAAGLVAALGVATARRGLVYADEVAFWADVVAKAPASARAHNNLGLALSVRCRLPEAEAAFQAALALAPDHARARVNLWLLRQGEPPGERRGVTGRCPPP
jgi:protein O-mannosyl-transferase